MRNFAQHEPQAVPSRPIAVHGLAKSFLIVSTLLLVLTACGSLAEDPAGDADTLSLELLVVTTQASETSTHDLDGTVVAGVIDVVARTNPRVTGVAFRLDDESAANDPVHVGTVAPYTFSLDTAELADGAHTLTATTIVRSGKPTTATAHFWVRNDGSSPPAPGEKLPVVEPTEPTPAPPTTVPSGWAFAPAPVPPATLYVAPNGSDGNSGRSESAPLRTVQQAANMVRPGDVVYLRGGVYPVQVGFNTSGTQDAPITWTSYPGEWAIFDGSDQVPVQSQHRVWVTNVSWNVFMNFEVRHSPREGIWLNNAHDNVFSHLITQSNHYSGITNYMSNRNRFEYIVTFGNYDIHNEWGKPGDDADGISIHTGDSNLVRHVIAFHNSDDGIDAWRSTNTIIENSISFGNGRGTHGNGNGIKGGGNYEANRTIVRNSIAFNNRSHGFDYNSGQHVSFIHTTAFGNGGYDYVADASTTLINNLSESGRLSIYGARSTTNSWDLGLSDASFRSIDPGHPSFLALTETSRAIDAGSPTGLPYTGRAPDLGALELGILTGDLIAPFEIVRAVEYAGLFDFLTLASGY